MDTPLISVIIPTRNRPDELERALASVEAQDLDTRLEVIIVDDGSEPPAQPSSRAGLPRVRVLRNEESLGAAAARNRGVETAVAPLIAFLDDDDEWLPGKLELQIEAFDDPAVDFCYTGFELYREEGRKRETFLPPEDPTTLADDLLTHDVVCLPTLVVRRALYDDVGGMDERFQAANDHDLCLRLASAGSGAPILEVLVHARSDMDRQSIRADLESHTAGRRLFLEKHAGLLASKKGATARHHLQIGQRFASAGRRSEARREFLAALRSGGRGLTALGHLLASQLLPTSLYTLLGKVFWRLKTNIHTTRTRKAAGGES